MFDRPIALLKRYWIEACILAFGLGALNFVFFAKAFRATGTIDATTAGQLGDFVGGYVGSYFALVSVVLLFATLNSQRKVYELQSFENKYFELLKMHRENVAELELQTTTGRKVFVLLIRELRSLLRVVNSVASKSEHELTQNQRMQIAYYCLYYGTGPNSTRMLRQAFLNFNPGFDVALTEAIIEEISRPEVKRHARKSKKFAFVPFEGHQPRLGHYYRHLYQAVRYVDHQTLKIDKYEYIKTIRAQLTTHEQALLLLNSRTPIGNDWWDAGFIKNYRMVQNLPEDFFNPKTELDLKTLFPANYFEWQDTKNANETSPA